MGVRSLAQLVRIATSVGVDVPTEFPAAALRSAQRLANQNDRPNVIDKPRSLFFRSAGGSLL
jgi:hypothetical protein